MYGLLVKASVIFALALLCPSRADAESKSVTLKVPQKFRGYSVRVDGKSYELNGSSVQVHQGSQTPRLELSDRHNRVMADAYTNIKPTTLANTRERPVQVGLNLGVVSEAGSRLKGLRLNGSASTVGFNVVYRPSPFGLMVGYSEAFFSTDERSYILDEGASSKLVSQRASAALLYEWAPIDSGPLFFARMHVALMLGVVWLSHDGEIKEDDVKISDTGKGWGPQTGLELRLPLPRNFWFYLQSQYQTYQLELDKFYFDESIHEFNISVGFRYAI